MPDQYRIRYKPVDGETWYETVTQQRWSTLSQLPANTEFEVQIRAEKGKQFGEYSASLRVNTTAADPNEFSCAIEGEAATSGEAVTSIMLSPGDVFFSRNFRFVVTSVTSAGGSFEGEALMPVPWFNGASVRVRFSGVRLDANYELVAGAYQSVYRPGSELTQVVDEVHSIGEATKD